MSDHLTSLMNAPVWLVPWFAFLAGLGGSLHCIGMCGGLVVSCGAEKKNLFDYHIGRFLGYALLGLLGGFLGKIFTIQRDNPIYALVPSILIGLIFIYLGSKSFFKGRVQINFVPSFVSSKFNQWQQSAFAKSLQLRNSFMIGLLSILLPCGLLYGVVLTLAMSQSPMIGLVSMITFWAGTLPGLVFAPSLFRKILTPLKNRLPLMSSFLLIGIGLTTIAWRVYAFNANGGMCH